MKIFNVGFFAVFECDWPELSSEEIVIRIGEYG